MFANVLHEHINGPGGTPSVAEEDAAAAVASWLSRVRPDLVDDEDVPLTPEVAPADVRYGCLLYGARLVARRGSPAGAAVNYDGSTGLPQATDPDISRLVGIGRWRKPTMVG